MTVGQVGLGSLSQAFSIPLAWLVGGLTQVAAVPLLGVARRTDREATGEPAVESSAEAPAA